MRVAAKRVCGHPCAPRERAAPPTSEAISERASDPGSRWHVTAAGAGRRSPPPRDRRGHSGPAAAGTAGGHHLQATDERAGLAFEPGSDGLLLTADHTIADLRLTTDSEQVALGFTDTLPDLGRLELRGLRLEGRLHLEAERAYRGELDLHDIHVAAADARSAPHRPAGFGVQVLAGGITVYNRSTDPASRWRLAARNLSGGSRERPLRGSGVFIFGGATPPAKAEPGSARPPPRREAASSW